MPIEDIETNRETFLDVAQQLYESGGFEAMSFRAIAQSRGCSSTLPYRYFASKSEMIDGLRIRAYQWLQGELLTAVSKADKPAQQLELLTAAYVDAAAARPRMYELLYSRHGSRDESDPALVKAKVDAISVCRDAIVSVSSRTDGGLRVDADTAAHIFWVAAHGLVSLNADGFLVVGRTAEQIFPALFDTISTGILAEAAP